MKMRSLKTLASVVAVLAALAVSTRAVAQTTCPAETTDARDVITRLVNSEDMAETRAKYNLPTLNPSDVRLLTDATDRATCTRLTEFVSSKAKSADWHTHFLRSYFTSGGFFYAVAVPKTDTTPPPPGYVRINLQWTPTYVLDSSFNLRAGIAM